MGEKRAKKRRGLRVCGGDRWRGCAPPRAPRLVLGRRWRERVPPRARLSCCFFLPWLGASGASPAYIAQKRDKFERCGATCWGALGRVACVVACLLGRWVAWGCVSLALRLARLVVRGRWGLCLGALWVGLRALGLVRLVVGSRGAVFRWPCGGARVVRLGLSALGLECSGSRGAWWGLRVGP